MGRLAGRPSKMEDARRTDIVSALVNLGYKKKDAIGHAHVAFSAARADGKHLHAWGTLETQVAYVLRVLKAEATSGVIPPQPGPKVPAPIIATPPVSVQGANAAGLSAEQLAYIKGAAPQIHPTIMVMVTTAKVSVVNTGKDIITVNGVELFPENEASFIVPPALQSPVMQPWRGWVD